MLSRCYKAFYVLLILYSTVNLPGVILLFKIRDASGERKHLITASNLMELPLTVKKSSNNVFEISFHSFYIVYYSIVCLDFFPSGGGFFDTFD